MVLSRGCTCLRSALPLARARSAPTQQNLYYPTEFRTHSCWDILPQISQIYTEIFAEKTPTDFTEHTELSYWDILPQISLSDERFSHRFHTQKLWCFQGGALVSSAPTQQNLYSPTEFRTHSCWDILPQISQNTQNFLAEKNFVKSVDSVGDIHALTSVRICEICGSFFNCKLRAVSQGPEHEKINLFLLICSPTDFSF